MPLTGSQIADLARILEEQWDLPGLDLLAADMGITLNNWAPDGSLKERAIKLIAKLNSESPPLDRVFLEKLRDRGNAILRNETTRLLTPSYLIPEDDPRNAIVLGKAAFIGRPDLRSIINDFTAPPSPNLTRILMIRGDEPGGKSYSWGYIRHVAISTVGAIPQRLGLKDTSYTPRQMMEQVAHLLGISTSGMPEMVDNPQLARISGLIGWFRGKLPTLQNGYWLVIDDLNHESVTPAMREMAYALASCVEDSRMNLWVVLLGYNAPITDPNLQYVAQEDARFPDAGSVAAHLERLASSSTAPLALPEAQELANLLFSKYPQLDKESMVKLKAEVENLGEKLMRGQRP